MDEKITIKDRNGREWHVDPEDYINEGEWFGKLYFLVTSCGFMGVVYLVESSSFGDAIDELIDSGKPNEIMINDSEIEDYTENEISYGGNYGVPYLHDLIIGGGECSIV